jgi:hypothetical protein
MDKSQNLPSIDEDALDGIAGGSNAATEITKFRMAFGSVATAPIKIAGAQVAAIGAGISAIGDAWQQVGDALMGVGKE